MLKDELIKSISKQKGEPNWMLEFRLKAFRKFLELDDPNFGPKLDINYKNFNYYKKVDEVKDDWKDVNCSIRDRFQDLGVIDAEQKYLGGVNNQFESETIYHNINKDIKDDGIIFLSTDDALKTHPELFKKYFNNLVKYDENKFTALNSALWSGGSFIYIPKGVHLDRPLQSYFRIDTNGLGQFERTIIIVDDDASLSYIEGCTAAAGAKNSLHAGVVEIYVGKNAKMKYSTIQNWSKEVYNLVTKRSIVDEGGYMQWLDGNVGSYITMKYPSSILKGDNSSSQSISVAYAKKNQVLDAGAKMIHLGKNTRSSIISKSISEEGGISNYRGKVKITKDAKNSKATVRCDTILMDEKSKSDTFPTNIVENSSSYLEHEATISKINDDELFYLNSKGLSEKQAKELIILGFIDEFKKELPMEYAIEVNRLLKEI